MLEKVMIHCNNYFYSHTQIYKSKIEIVDGEITANLPFLKSQFIKVEGSVLNDGIYQFPVTELFDETFTGNIYGLAIPGNFIKLVEDIEKYNEKNFKTAVSSTSFGGFSESYKENSDWQSAFKKELNVYRKLR